MTHRPQIQDSDTKEEETYCSASSHSATTVKGHPCFAHDLADRVLVATLRNAHGDTPTVACRLHLGAEIVTCMVKELVCLTS